MRLTKFYENEGFRNYLYHLLGVIELCCLVTSNRMMSTVEVLRKKAHARDSEVSEGIVLFL